MKRCVLLLLCVLLLPWPALAQTRAWLDRNPIAYGETVALNIETDQPVRALDYTPLTAQFEIAGQSVRRSYGFQNGHASSKTVFSVGLRPRQAGTLVIPALQVGKQATKPLQLQVQPPSVQQPDAGAALFVETRIDSKNPYVQQAVGVSVLLNSATPLLSGQLELDAPANASLRRVGNDISYQREVDGRRYKVIERRYLLIPERSGELLLQGARFNGISVDNRQGWTFGDARKPVSAASAPQRLQVLPVPDNAPQPWLPLHQLTLRYTKMPKQAWVGKATTLEIELFADGATASQLPALKFPEQEGVQVFAEPPQWDERFIGGRPTTTLRQRFSLVPTRTGSLHLPGPQIEWWDAVAGKLRSTRLPPLLVPVAAGPGGAAAKPDAMPQPDVGSAGPDALAAGEDDHWQRLGVWLVLPLLLPLLAGIGWWRWQAWRLATPAVPVQAPATLKQALSSGDLAAVWQALCVQAGAGHDAAGKLLDALDSEPQRAALRQLQAARWGDGDPEAALLALRQAFAKGARWRRVRQSPPPLLPPLYPE